MADASPDMQERLELCDLLDELGPSAPTLLEGWTAHDLAAHLVLRNTTPLPALASFCRVASNVWLNGVGSKLAQREDFARLVERIRSGPPIGFFRIGWVRALANLNEFFVHHEDVRRANSGGPRRLTPPMDAALWRNVRRGSRDPCRRLDTCGDRPGRSQRASDGSTGRTDGSTQRHAGRAPVVRLWASSRGAGGSDWATGGRCGGASHALRHVSPYARFILGITVGLNP